MACIRYISVDNRQLTNVLSSPKFPTPRRALFTSNMMGDADSYGTLFYGLQAEKTEKGLGS